MLYPRKSRRIRRRRPIRARQMSLLFSIVTSMLMMALVLGVPALACGSYHALA